MHERMEHLAKCDGYHVLRADSPIAETFPFDKRSVVKIGGVSYCLGNGLDVPFLRGRRKLKHTAQIHWPELEVGCADYWRV